MKKLVLVLSALTLSATSALAQDPSEEEMCLALAALAGNVMAYRQYDLSREQVEVIVDTVTRSTPVKNLLHTYVDEAFDGSVGKSEMEQRVYIRAFSNKTYETCMSVRR